MKQLDKPVVFLSDAIIGLRDEVKILRQVLDEVREELSWANNNARDLPSEASATNTIHRITSMPRDPTVRDCPIDDVPEQTISRLRNEASSETCSQRSLF